MRPSDHFVDGPVVSFASPVLRVIVGRGVEMALAELRRDNAVQAVPADVVNTLLMLVAIGRERRSGISPARADSRNASVDCANGANVPTTMTTAEVATVLSVTEGRVRQLAKSGALPSKLVGGARRYRSTDVDAFEAKRTGGNRHG